MDGEKESSNLGTQFNLLAFFILLNVIHLSIATIQQSEDTAVDKCATNSFLMLYLFFVTFAILCASSVIRSHNSFSLMVEVGLSLVYIMIATVLAGASGEADVCSAAANSHSNSVYWLADILGTGSVIAVVIATYARPFIKNSPLLSCGLLAVIAILVQVTLFDLVLVPEISKVWQHIETNGTALDDDLSSISDRITDLESLLNQTL